MGNLSAIFCLNVPDAFFLWGVTLILDEEGANFRWGDAFLYNLSTGYGEQDCRIT